MANDISDLIAESVRVAFAGGYAADPRTISQDIDVQRVHVTQVDKLDHLKDWDSAAPAAKAIKVYIVALPEVKDYQTRAKREALYSVQVAIAAKPKVVDTTTIHVDSLKGLAGELRDWFFVKGRMLPGREEAIEDITNLVTVDFESLKTKRLFLSEFVLKFTGTTE